MTTKHLVERSEDYQRLRNETRERHPEPVPEPVIPDLRSPLERYRSKPRKSLSVTDLVSPSWCELQYWYNLTKYGRKRPTRVMEQGSKIHKTLENEVHQTVSVSITTKEDAWGLRIWNIIQGLRTLQETGLTRELEVWGVIDGLVVNGIIDELSYICPDRELEEADRACLTKKESSPANQASITNFLKPASSQINERGEDEDINPLIKRTPRVYITDVKTRTVKSVPKGAAFRPTLMQLMLYHRLFSDLATNKIDVEILFDRFNLDPNQNFSDAFIAQITSINEIFYDAPPIDSGNQDKNPSLSLPNQSLMQLILNHNTLSKLWAFMIQEFHRALPAGLDSIGNVLKAEYRAQSDGVITGFKTFLYDHNIIQAYLDDELRWWKGERPAKGVCIEEAYKCTSCEFADDCSWRKERIEEATERYRARTRSVV